MSALEALIGAMNAVTPDVGLRVLDIGARGGLGASALGGLRCLRSLHAEAVEPEPDEARRLAATGEYARVHQAAVWSRPAPRMDLFVTRSPACSSLRRPRTEMFARDFPAAEDWFTVERTVPVVVTALDALFPAGAGGFDIVKVDVQGADLDVLEGGGRVLDEAVGVFCEVQYQEMYEGQALAPAIVSRLTGAGYALVGHEHHERAAGPSFGGQIIEADCAFVREPRRLRSLGAVLGAALAGLVAGNVFFVDGLIFGGAVAAGLGDDDRERLGEVRRHLAGGWADLLDDERSLAAAPAGLRSQVRELRAWAAELEAARDYWRGRAAAFGDPDARAPTG